MLVCHFCATKSNGKFVLYLFVIQVAFVRNAQALRKEIHCSDGSMHAGIIPP